MSDPYVYLVSILCLVFAWIQMGIADAARKQRDKLQAELAGKTEEANTLHEQLADIGNYAHIYSAGPGVPDHLWEIRQRANDAL